MGTKNNPGRFDCYANADRDEPMFVLLGRDVHAHSAVRKWADDREHLINVGMKPESDRAMVAEARECADAMLAYYRRLKNIEYRSLAAGDRRLKISTDSDHG